jgi:hypothetical protein
VAKFGKDWQRQAAPIVGAFDGIRQKGSQLAPKYHQRENAGLMVSKRAISLICMR